MTTHTITLVAFAALTLGFQALSLKAFASSISVSGLGMLTVGFAFGVWQAVVVAVLAAAVHAAIRRPQWYKVAFNVGCFAVSTAAAVGLYRGLGGPGLSTAEQVGLAICASCVFLGLNSGMLAAVMALNERRSLVPTWRARLSWFSTPYLVFGPLALLAALSYRHSAAMGPLVLLAGAALAGGALHAAFAKARVRGTGLAVESA
jgi:hypothetical protein